MPEATERDILIEVRTKVEALHGELLGAPGREGRMPKLESTVDEHAAQLNQLSGSMGTSKWFLAGIGALLLVLIAAFTTHLLGGK